jgi:hypothetical protein
MTAVLHTRPVKEVAERLLLVASVCAVASDRSLRHSVVAWLKRENLWPSASPREKSFLEATKAEVKDEIHHSWGAEAVYVFGWALSLVPDLQPPTSQASTSGILDQIPAPGDATNAFLSRAVLRSAVEIHSAAEELCNAHACCRSAKSQDRPARHGYDIEVAQERHRAVNWLICYEDADWDHVATDT